MTNEHYEALRYLVRCTFLPGSYVKRFVNDLFYKPIDTELTEKQAAYLDKVTWQYRKQLLGRGYPNTAYLVVLGRQFGKLSQKVQR
ncbi:MAG: hypothetical protein LC130_03970 [Bryobacterales bacterium]|nr:hypothetical protein [Bryobacterales bacterium]